MNKINMKNTESIKYRRIAKKRFSKVLNFICALIITFVVMIAIGAFLSADLHSKDMLGDYDSQIFSFNRVENNKAELMAFGEKFILDFDKIHNAQKKLNTISNLNKEYTPAIFILSGDIIEICILSIGDSFKKIPDIIAYLYNQTLD